MTTHREAIFVDGLWVDKTPLDSAIPQVDEVGVTSAPMFSMSYFFGSYCKVFSEDFMLCKNESQDPKKCLKEGRKVTRCAIDLIEKLKANCDNEWEAHWDCLDRNNHRFEKCRKKEAPFNKCVFDKLVT
ncbi:hypothetical protein BC833DRAFT_623722 [Globomyces pollinis-pini]|nr:hypothetical protein BC833DRAFT_623722 [Globomyces pollinis-pini]